MEPGRDSPQDILRTSGAGFDADGVWMNVTELSHARGISRASAARLVRRRKWRKRTDNHGVVHVLVPHEATEMTDKPVDGHPTGVRADVSRAVSALEAAVASLTEQLAVANQRADRLDLIIENERGLRLAIEVKAGHDRDAAVAQANELRDHLERVQREAQDAGDAADRLEQADNARRAMRPLARAWAAFRGR